MAKNLLSFNEHHQTSVEMLNESEDKINLKDKFAFIQFGGSIGELARGIGGFKDSKNFTIFSTGNDEEALKEKAKRYNKMRSPGEKSYYKIFYTVIELNDSTIKKYDIKKRDKLKENLTSADIDRFREEGEERLQRLAAAVPSGKTLVIGRSGLITMITKCCTSVYSMNIYTEKGNSVKIDNVLKKIKEFFFSGITIYKRDADTEYIYLT